MANNVLVREIQKAFIKENMPEFKTGMEVEVYQNLKEGDKVRVQRFKGLVIKTSGSTPLEKTITVRRKVGPFGVERIFAVHAPTIEKIEIIRQFKVRRSNLAYIRPLTGKASKLKEIK